MPAQASSRSKRAVIIGGGAAGVFCAVNAARMHPGLEVILLEKSARLLSKVQVSGGGRCNLTHQETDIARMSRSYPRGEHFVRKAFHQFFTTDTISWFSGRGVPLKTEADGRMFPVSDSSRSVIDCLLREAGRYQVQLRMQADVRAVERTGDRFLVHLAGGQPLEADAVCVACGGLPKAAQFAWLERLGHPIEPPVPSLFTFNLPGHPLRELMGLSVEDARVRVTGTSLEQRGPVLVTHWGLSGPAVLRLSAWGARLLAERQYRFQVQVNWVPGYPEPELRQVFRRVRETSGSRRVYNRNPPGLPQRLWEFLAGQAAIGSDLRWADLNAARQNHLIRLLVQQTLEVQGKTTFKEEFVTAGGIRLSDVDPATMQSRIVPGLFFAGEVLDVDGVTGGYNFQHAWTSGFIAARHLG
ncbi:MAG TPA: NAD(P)/FAD-dependent oxidoreductase [Chitinophagaceae bacterium]|nr:NAD(P)/FAD-dependent oxidoreductase [Chitinophagaceae bacterium]